MAGWNLKEGECVNLSLEDSELSRIFSLLFSNLSKKETSYKFGLVKALLDNLYNVDANLSLSFDSIFSTFTEIYWNLVLKHHLKQQSGPSAKINSILTKLYSSFAYKEIIPFENLSNEQKLTVIKEVTKECSKYVFGALFEDTDHKLFSFSKSGKFLQFHPDAYRYMCRNKVLLEKVNYFEWSRFLEKVNSKEYTDYLATKIDESTQRSDLSVYRDILYEEFECNTCFYCGKKLKKEIHVDHFIPWSFVKEDKLYNFVLACPKCNIKKSNKLAPDTMIHKVVDRNNNLIVNEKRIDAMYRIDTKIYTDNTISNLYDYALMNGFRRFDVKEII